jgi:hypothetical protein
MKVYVGEEKRYLGDITNFDLSITREMAPQFVIGSNEPVSFHRGKEGIGGTLTFIRNESIPSEFITYLNQESKVITTVDNKNKLRRIELVNL